MTNKKQEIINTVIEEKESLIHKIEFDITKVELHNKRLKDEIDDNEDWIRMTKRRIIKLKQEVIVLKNE